MIYKNDEFIKGSGDKLFISIQNEEYRLDFYPDNSDNRHFTEFFRPKEVSRVQKIIDSGHYHKLNKRNSK